MKNIEVIKIYIYIAWTLMQILSSSCLPSLPLLEPSTLREWILIPDASQNCLQRLKHTHILTEHAQGEDGFEVAP